MRYFGLKFDVVDVHFTKTFSKLISDLEFKVKVAIHGIFNRYKIEFNNSLVTII
jgi:hypothetical protein